MFLLFVYKNRRHIMLFYTCSSLLDKFLVLPQMESDEIKAHVFLLCNSRSSINPSAVSVPPDSSAVNLRTSYALETRWIKPVRGGYFGLGPHLRTKRDFYFGNGFEKLRNTKRTMKRIPGMEGFMNRREKSFTVTYLFPPVKKRKNVYKRTKIKCCKIQLV